MIPNFKTPDDETTFWNIFDEELLNYVYALGKVKEQIYKNESYFSLSPHALEQLRHITDDLLYQTVNTFEDSTTVQQDDYNPVSKEELQEAIREVLTEESQFSGLGGK
ncbi:hypothetical protein SSZBM1_34 [Synechococcus phage S-SZBM1]|uniref:Uncharacterized protein n=1 Tax=Synechococcus phage S-SZBM1 TaxID=2926475 RepID=A0AC61TSF7_9CAUD|nr:hypothetical protein PP650_gp034 [Synechococcus phage S-SZBM1]UNH61151.1 hypothetical protein SSZBM1_34 [Synechococcus phage S-SZBM1]